MAEQRKPYSGACSSASSADAGFLRHARRTVRPCCAHGGPAGRVMESSDPEIGTQIRQDEHEADRIKVRNIHVLNESFSTPMDRETSTAPSWTSTRS